MNKETRSAAKEAIRLTKILDVFCQIHGGDRYPVNVEKLALECASFYQWDDPISEVRGADITGFDGGLFKDSDSGRWLLLYNHAVDSPGRIRFTQAHELGHYILHRQTHEAFECSEVDMLNWDPQEKDIESQADKFASHLLMPLHDYRNQLGDSVDLNALGHCADRYGVSLTAAILKWLDYTDQKAMLVHSRDGYIKWSWSSQPAFKAGAFFKSKGPPVAVPVASLAANHSLKIEKSGQNLQAKIWFEHADSETPLREMKLSSDRYDTVLSLLVLPTSLSAWRPRY